MHQSLSVHWFDQQRRLAWTGLRLRVAVATSVRRRVVRLPQWFIAIVAQSAVVGDRG